MERKPMPLEEWKKKAAASYHLRKGETVLFRDTINNGNLGVSATINGSHIFLGHYFLKDRDENLEGTGWVFGP